MKWLCTDPSRCQQKELSNLFHPCDTDLTDGNRPFAEDEGGKDHGTDATFEMIESVWHFINKDIAKGLMSMGEEHSMTGWRVRTPQFKNSCPKLEVLHSSAFTVQKKKNDAGTVSARVHLPPSHLNWLEVFMKEHEWTVRMDIIQENHTEIDCLMMQQMAQARASRTVQVREWQSV